MKSIATRIEKLEKDRNVAMPIFDITFEDGTNEKATIVQLAMMYFDMEAGICAKTVQKCQLIRGNANPFYKLTELIGVEW